MMDIELVGRLGIDKIIEEELEEADVKEEKFNLYMLELYRKKIRMIEDLKEWIKQ